MRVANVRLLICICVYEMIWSFNEFVAPPTTHHRAKANVVSLIIDIYNPPAEIPSSSTPKP